ncbi:MAG: hypothetical protein OQK95_05580, partial [Gammaproteobacteria bacterium]|nr:hypothetical protein [Gammaproteobacteria bacterium]
VRLIDGTTGIEINMLAGDTPSDAIGSRGIIALANNNFVIASIYDDEIVVDGGSVRLVDGSTGVAINMLAGDTANDQLGFDSVTTLANNNFVIVSKYDDEGGIVNSGSVRQIDGTTGNPIRSLVGSVTGDMNSVDIVESPRGDFYIISLAEKDNNSIVDSGFVTLIAQPIVN